MAGSRAKEPRFTQELHDKFKCSLCTRLLREPRQIRCGHRYCKTCLDGLLSDKNGSLCPACERELEGRAPTADELSDGLLDARFAFDDAALKREIAKLECGCPNLPCKWTGPFRDFERHMGDCVFIDISCPNYCGFAGPSADMDRHLRSECLLRQTTCQYCDAAVLQSQLEVHLTACPKRSVLCVYCSETMAAEKLEAHQSGSGDCARTYARCPYGCKDPIKPDNMEKHKEKCVLQHLEHMLTSIIAFAQSDGSAGSSHSLGSSGEGASASSSTTLSASDAAWAAREFANDRSISEATEALYNEAEKQLSVHVDNLSLYNAMQLTVETYLKENEGAQKLVEERKRSVERHVHLKDASLNFMAHQTDNIELATYDGTLLWRVDDISSRRQEAVSGRVPSIYSHSFYTSRTGYKMCARLYLNGDGTGKGSHMSLFFVLQKGPYDAMLKWPFAQKVTLMLINQNLASGGSGKDLVDAFRADPNSSSFRRPVSDMNIASGCPTFCTITDLLDPSRGYVKENCLFIKIVVDRGGLTES